MLEKSSLSFDNSISIVLSHKITSSHVTLVAVRVDDSTAIQGGDSTAIQVRFIHVNRP